MDRPKIEIRFYETYYIANAVRNILHDQSAYLRGLDDFYGDGRCLGLIRPFHRYSALHAFIYHVASEVILDATLELPIEERQDLAEKYNRIPAALADLQPSRLPINSALDHHKIEHVSFEDFLKDREIAFADATQDDVYDYVIALREEGPAEELLDRVVEEVFFVIFQNRGLLLLFNGMMAWQVKDTDLGSVEEAEMRALFTRGGRLRRVNPPRWVRRAVFYRDRGCCVLCHSDLSGLISAWPSENFDHIVPLDSGGLNDVSNIQLLCSRCNGRKAAGKAVTTDVYEAWYPSGNDH